jgi:FkbM family methyltransferase
MNLRAFLHLLGFRPAPRFFGHRVVTFTLPVDGEVQLAQWQHPSETPKLIEQALVDQLRTFLRPGDVALDIGAHSGDTSVPIALAVGGSGRVFALEPNPYVFPVLAANAALNGSKTAITALNFAATAKSGSVTFSYSDSGFCNGGQHAGVGRWRHAHPFDLTVRGENLASYLKSHHPDAIARIRFIKVDAEGADLDVLATLAEIVAEVRPFIRAEVHKLMPAGRRRELFEWLIARGYAVHRVESDARYCGERLEIGDLGRWKQFDVFAVPV